MLHLQCNGLLHSDICGSILACNSPQLFAAYRVLRRLPMPRHPPCALISLTVLIPSESNFELLRNSCSLQDPFTNLSCCFDSESNGSELCLSHYEKFYFVVFLPRCFTCVRYYTFFPHCITFALFSFQDAFDNLSIALVGTSGLEPPTSRLSGVRSNHLSYAPVFTVCSWKFSSFPFSHLVEMRRIELLTPCLQSRCSPS